MKRAFNVLGIVAIAALPAMGCSEDEEAPAATEEAAPIPELSVGEVAERLEAGSIVVVDANGPEIRGEHGVIPGARLLSSSGRYDPEAELPSDRSAALVFYCGNTNCRASDGAAARARDAGWENVSVLRAGIAGWVEAGRETTPPPQS